MEYSTAVLKSLVSGFAVPSNSACGMHKSQCNLHKLWYTWRLAKLTECGTNSLSSHAWLTLDGETGRAESQSLCRLGPLGPLGG